MRLIDADALMSQTFSTRQGYDAVLVEDIVNAPTVDAEPVVRCKDCVYCGKKINEQQRECKFWIIEIIPSKDYCSRYCKVGGADNA